MVWQSWQKWNHGKHLHWFAILKNDWELWLSIKSRNKWYLKTRQTKQTNASWNLIYYNLHTTLCFQNKHSVIVISVLVYYSYKIITIILIPQYFLPFLSSLGTTQVFSFLILKHPQISFHCSLHFSLLTSLCLHFYGHHAVLTTGSYGFPQELLLNAKLHQ